MDLATTTFQCDVVYSSTSTVDFFECVVPFVDDLYTSWLLVAGLITALLVTFIFFNFFRR